MVWSHHGRQGPHTVFCWQQLHHQTVFYNQVCRTLHSTGGEGKMMMCVCVLILPVCFTRPHGMFLVLYRVTNHMAGAPPSLSETGTYIYIHKYIYNIYIDIHIYFYIYISIYLCCPYTSYISLYIFKYLVQDYTISYHHESYIKQCAKIIYII